MQRSTIFRLALWHALGRAPFPVIEEGQLLGIVHN